jgi:predicted aminopeptidase
MIKTLAAFLLIFVFLPGCYVTQQAYWQTKLFLGREPLEEVSSVAQETKDWIDLVLKEAEAIGLNVGSAYRHVVFPKDNTVSWSVSAAYPLELKSYTWWFPIVGKVPYKGFYDRKDRDEEARRLEEKGFDVNLSRVEAFSSLGWFPDPLFPSMLELKPHDLAHLLFHELTHRTFWIGGGVELNENMAEFIAEKATLSFLKKRNIDSETYFKSRRSLSQSSLWLVDLEKDLRGLYEIVDLSDDQKKQRKKDIFQFHLDKRKTAQPHYNQSGDKPWNNARVMASKIYLGRQVEIEQKYICFAGLGQFVEAVKKINALEDLKSCMTKASGNLSPAEAFIVEDSVNEN